MQVLVTGGAGFIGSHVAEALLRRGDSLRIVDNFNSFYDTALKWRNIEAIRQTGRFDLIEGDLLDAGIRQRALQGCDAVIHLAAWAGVRPSIEMPVPARVRASESFDAIATRDATLGRSPKIPFVPPKSSITSKTEPPTCAGQLVPARSVGGGQGRVGAY